MREWIEARGPPNKDAIEAIRYLVLSNEDGNIDGRENLMEWYVCEVRRHFLGWVKPSCNIPEVSIIGGVSDAKTDSASYSKSTIPPKS